VQLFVFYFTAFIIQQLKAKNKVLQVRWATKSMTEKTDCNTTRAVEALALCGWHCPSRACAPEGGSSFHHGQREHLFFTAFFQVKKKVSL
jgi:hypothetical protein